LVQTLQDAKQMMETNFLSVVALTKEVVKGMIARNRGHIVMMSSIAGKEGYHGAQHTNAL
jgi:NADP-dependent 3-hydroxy acid dehydrogenase YdfG